ncbi:hypothetical protein SAMN05192559_10463 [Halobacillus karajensis]|nr:hypothetical protein [Halobacillus karajensis]SEH77774.1 hypothetical protein SAMN05192559_10463 [Halobacillus karajensis]
MKQMTSGEMKIFTQRFKKSMELPIDRHHKEGSEFSSSKSKTL